MFSLVSCFCNHIGMNTSYIVWLVVKFFHVKVLFFRHYLFQMCDVNEYIFFFFFSSRLQEVLA
jgi:hypothetical protein